MALKRSIADSEQAEPRAQRKRARLSPSGRALSDSSAMSPGSSSEASALSSSPELTVRGQESSVSSAPSHGNDEDFDSSMESSDESSSSTAVEDDDEDEDDESIREPDTTVTLGAPKKPMIDPKVLSDASDLASRLKAFLPQMQQANSELAERGAGMSMEDVDDEEEHIEMSLGLGVLEQKKADGLKDFLRRKSQPGSDDERSDHENDASSGDEPDVLGRLMNMERDSAKVGQPPGIEEVESRPDSDVAPVAARGPSEERRAHMTLR